LTPANDERRGIDKHGLNKHPDLEEKKAGHTAACILSVEEIEESKHHVDEELGVKR
jgi:hypothetical protein